MQIYKFLSEKLSTSKQEISLFALDAPKKYKIYTIPKRTSGKRVIAHPAKKLKEYQRTLIELLGEFLPVHDAAFAYRKNLGIKQNAQKHLRSKYLLKMDFQNFFTSITPQLFFSILHKLELVLSKEDQYLLTQLLFFNPSKINGRKLLLSIGAPSSPLISNFVMHYFDEELSQLCADKNISYTRYADDITFSTNVKNALFETEGLVKKLLKKHFEGAVTVNESKTIFSSKSHNRHVTGVTLTNDERLSIGRQRKRYISSLIHRFNINQLSDEDFRHLQGLLAFANDIEPVFKNRMIRKYSLETINQIVSGDQAKR